MITRRSAIAATALATLPIARARAASGVKLGVLTDMSGPYKSATGPVSAASTQLAADEFAKLTGIAVEVVVADHQNKPDVAVSVARQWFDQDGVDAIIDVPTSSVALAIAGIIRDKNKVTVNCGGATADLTGSACNPNTVHWSYDTISLAAGLGRTLTRRGGTSWFVIAPNYVFGQQLARDTARYVTAGGGTMAGTVFYPFPETKDFSSFILQAKASGAKVIGFANAGEDQINCIKQAREFGIDPDETVLAPLLGSIQVFHGAGLEVTQGLFVGESFYWDRTDRARAYTKRLMERTGGLVANSVQAGCYSGTLHYLKAVKALGVERAKADGAAAVAHMKANDVDDDCWSGTRVRADGRHLFPGYLFQIKTPAESRYPYDYYKLIETTPAEEIAATQAEAKCPLWTG